MRALGLVGYGEIAEGQAGELDQVDSVLEVLDGVDAFAEPEDEGWGEQGRDADLAEADIFARASPRDKLRIVQAFQNAGRVVAMTGTGSMTGPP